MVFPEMMPGDLPPQGVLDQRLYWRFLLILLMVTLLLRIIGLDFAGALLSGLLLCFACIMTTDNMQDMAKYALIYAVICGLNFVFDILPLISELRGRTSRMTTPAAVTSESNGVQHAIYTVTTKSTPFFDAKLGLLHNIHSLSMCLSPVCMVLAVYLSVSAHIEIQRQAALLLEEMQFRQVDLTTFDPSPTNRMWSGSGGLIPRSNAGTSSSPSALANGGINSSHTGPSGGSRSTFSRDAFERFQGQGHKLG